MLKPGDREAIERVERAASELREAVDALPKRVARNLRHCVMRRAEGPGDPRRRVRLSDVPDDPFSGEVRGDESGVADCSLLTVLESLEAACTENTSAFDELDVDHSRSPGRPADDRKKWSEWLAHHLSDVFDEFCPTDEPTKKQRREFINVGVTIGWDDGVSTTTIKNYLEEEPPGVVLPNPEEAALAAFRRQRRRKAQLQFEAFVAADQE